ncbi:MAG: hypothetical protein ACOC33_04010 [bacterium]
MENTIEIKIECKGKAAGTLGWLNSILSNGELVIKENKNGVPAMFLKIPKANGDGYNYDFICRKRQPSDEDCWQYDQWDDDILAIFPEEAPEHYGFSGYKLTPAANRKFYEFMKLAIQKFDEWWDNDK